MDRSAPGDDMTGFAEAQPLLAANGWPALPLPASAKYPPPNGFTGKNGAWPTEIDYAVWRETFRDGNTGIRMPIDIVVDGANYWGVGFDVDGYGTKTGAATLAEAEKRFGPLPPTDRITSREDGVSGIKLYLVPAGTVLHGNLKFPELGYGDIDLIQWFHRYAVTSPSIHPEGRRYRCIDEATGTVKDTPRPPGELPLLPEPYIEELRINNPRNNSKPAGEKPPNPRRERSVLNVTAAMTEGRPSAKVAQRLAEALADLAEGLNRHDTMCPHVMALLRHGRNGEPGVELALITLDRAFTETVGPDRSGGEREAMAEFERMCSNAETLLAAEPPQRFEWPGPRPTFDEQACRDRSDEQPEADFWSQRDTLQGIHDFARSHGGHPVAVLGGVLRRAIARVEPRVKLPGIVGGEVSANLFTVTVGGSGVGKDLANEVASGAVEFRSHDDLYLDEPLSPGLGSGEGLARVFKGFGKGDVLERTQAHLLVNEVSRLKSLADRKGYTAVSELLQAYMGQPLGFSNAQKATTTFIPKHSYRLCLGISAQPENADFFLSREKDGFPQRFLWLPTVDPHCPPPGDEDDEQIAEHLTVRIPAFDDGLLGPGCDYLIGVPKAIRERIRHFRWLVKTGSKDVDPLDGHLMLTRLKVSFGLALLEGRQDINEDDWRIAGQLLDISKRVRDDTRWVIAESHRKKHTARAHDQAYRDAIVAEKLTERLQQRVKGAIDRKLSDVGAASRRDLQNACSSVIKPEFPPVFDLLLDQGYLVVEGGEGIGKLYRLANP